MLTLDQILAELQQAGADERWITPEGYAAIDRAAADYIFRYSKAMGGGSICSACHGYADTRCKRHEDFLRCSACGKLVQLRDEWRGHKHLFSQGLDYIWRQSDQEPETLIVTAVKSWRDYGCGSPELSQRRYHTEAIYQFSPGYARKYEALRRFDGEWKDAGFREQKRGIGPVNIGWDNSNCNHHYMRTAMSCTRIGRLYARLDNATTDGLNEIKTMGAICTKPYIEYLCAAGQDELAAEIALGIRGIVKRPRARDIRGLLGLTEGQWYEVRRDKGSLNAEILHALDCLQTAGRMTVTIKAARAAARMHGYSSLHRLKEGAIALLGNVPDKLRRKAVRRAAADQEIYTWVDYWQQLRTLGENMTDSRLLIPKDLHGMHQRMTDRLNTLRVQRQVELDAEKRKDFETRLKRLKQTYTFESCGLVLRPFESAEEVIDEGKALSICIGGYANRYLKGDTILCALRRAEAPEAPWRAVEFSAMSGALVQDRGAYNDRGRGKDNLNGGVAEWLSRFWAAFEARRAEETRKKGRNAA